MLWFRPAVGSLDKALNSWAQSIGLQLYEGAEQDLLGLGELERRRAGSEKSHCCEEGLLIAVRLGCRLGWGQQRVLQEKVIAIVRSRVVR